MLLKKEKTNQNSVRLSKRANLRGTNYSYYGQADLANQPSGGPRQNVYDKQTTTTRLGFRYWLKRTPAIIAFLVIISSLIFTTTLSAKPRIVWVGEYKNAQYLNPTAYYKIASSLLSSHLANRDKLTINSTSIANSMQQEFPELANVSVVLPIVGRQPIFYLEPASPDFILSKQVYNTYYLISGNGKAIQLLDNIKAVQQYKIPIITDLSGLTVSVGHSVLSQSDLDFINEIELQFSSQKIEISKLVLPVASREIDIYPNSEPYFVKFDLNDTGTEAQQIGTYFATKDYLQQHNAHPEHYIDVRVPGRVYFK